MTRAEMDERYCGHHGWDCTCPQSARVNEWAPADLGSRAPSPRAEQQQTDTDRQRPLGALDDTTTAHTRNAP